MRTKRLVAVSMAGAIVQLATTALAQDSDQPGKGWRHSHEEHLANLSPEERQRVEAAHQKAMQDASVQAAHNKVKEARREFQDAMHAAMVKADPSIQPLLDKIPKHEKPGD